jgi:hypothetical protein
MSDGGSSSQRFEDPFANESAEPPSGVLSFAG